MTPVLAVVGCGRVFEQFHHPAILRSGRWRIGAVADPSESRRNWVGSRLPNAAVFPSIEPMLEAFRPDAVLIAAPPMYHADLTLRALGAGLHVFVEKPCGMSAAEARKMGAAAEAHQRHLRVGFNRRFHETYLELRRATHDLNGDRRWTLDFRLGFSIEGWSAYSRYLGTAEAGGGVLHDVASHQLDAIQWLLPGPIASIRAVRHHRPSLEEELEYLVEWTDGSHARCLARHGVAYLETLLLGNTQARLLGFPTGVLRSSGEDDGALARAASRKAWIDRKMIRVGVRRDRMLRSYAAQWRAFGDLVSGSGDGDRLATVSDAVRVHVLLKGLASDAARLGRRGRPGLSAARKRARRRTTRSADGPGATVIMVVGNQRARAAEALRSVLAQDEIGGTEVILVDLGDADQPPLAGSDHPSVHLLWMAAGTSYGQARAEAVRRARGDVVAFLEEHCRVAPGWLGALTARLDGGPWVAVGPRVVSGNPGSGFSDAMGLINYGAWTGPQTAREMDMLPGNNSAYRRQALLDFEPDLSRLLMADTVLQWRLAEDGGRLCVEPEATLAHRYPTGLWSAAKGEYLYHVCFADVRAQSFGWTVPMRLAYAAGSVLIPWLRLARMLRAYRDLEAGVIVRKNLVGVFLLLSAAVAGQAVGVLFGSRGSERRFTEFELNEPRPTREEAAARR